MDWTLLLAYLVGLALVYALARAFAMPLRLLLQLFYNAAVGGIALLGVNWLGDLAVRFGLPVTWHLPVNPLTGLIVGAFGVPGLAAVAIVNRVLE